MSSEPDTARKSVSMPGEMYQEALARAQRMGYGSFSEYVQHLIAEDLTKRPPHIKQEPDEKKATR